MALGIGRRTNRSLALGISIGMAGCSLIANPDTNRLYPGGGPCTDPTQCDDGNLCTSDACVANTCMHAPRDRDGDGHGDAGCGGDDCDDTNPNVHPGAGENCADGVDNDCNGLVDGADPACIGLSMNDTCSSALPIASGASLMGNTNVYADNYYSSTCMSAPAGGRDGVFSVTLGGREEVDFDTFGSAIDTVLYLRTDCGSASTEFACANNVDISALTRLVVRDLAPGLYFLFLDTDRSSLPGAFSLHYTARTPRGPLGCGNAMDVSGGAVVYGSTVGSSDGGGGSCGGRGSPEDVFTITLTAPVTRLIAHTHDSTFDTILYMRTSCGPTGVEVQCNDDDPTSPPTSGFEWTGAPPGVYYLYVDGYLGAAGNYRLQVWVDP